MRATIRFAASLTVLAAALLLGPLSALADVLVLRDGSVVETKGPWRADDSAVHYFGLDDKPRSVALELVDLDASRDRSAPGQPVLASRVTLYATSWCGYCRKTRELLKSLNVPVHREGHREGRRRVRRIRPQGGPAQRRAGARHGGDSGPGISGSQDPRDHPHQGARRGALKVQSASDSAAGAGFTITLSQRRSSTFPAGMPRRFDTSSQRAT